MKINASQIVIIALLAISAFVLFVVLGGGSGGNNSPDPSASEDSFLDEVRELQETTPPKGDEALATLPPEDEDQSLVPAIEIATDTLDMGLVSNSEITHSELVIANRGKAPLHIRDIKTSCHCTEGHLPEDQRTILPGDQAVVDVTLNPFRVAGFESEKVLTFLSNDPQNPTVNVKVLSKIDPEFSIEPKEIAFGNVDRGDTPTVSLRLRQLTDRPFEIKEVNTVGGNKEMTPFTDINLAYSKRPESEWKVAGKAEWDITATLTPSIPPGELQRFVFIVTDLPRVPNYAVKITANVVSSILVEPAFPRPVTLKKGSAPNEVLPGTVTVTAEDVVEIINTDYNTELLKVTPRSGENAQVMHLDIELAPTATPGALQEQVRFVVRSSGKDREEKVLVRAYVPNNFGN